MARDYSKKRIVRRQKRSMKQLVVMLAVFLTGYLSATIFDLTSVSSWISRQTGVPTTPVVKDVAHKTALPKPKFEFYTILAKDGRAAPRSDAKNEDLSTAKIAQKVETAASEPPAAPTGIPKSGPPIQVIKQDAVTMTKPAPNTPKTPLPAPNLNPQEALAPTSSNDTAEHYVVQVAAFKNRQDADRLKANFALKGLDAVVVLVNQQNNTWYRVMLGPFVSRDEAMRIQGVVSRTEHINGMVRRVGV